MEISSGMIQIAGKEGSFDGFLARPTVDGPHPAVIVVMEAFGLNDHIKDVAQRIAREGFVTLAPDMYHRAGRNSVIGYDNLPEAIRLMTGLTDDQIVADIAAVTSYLQQQSFVKGDKIGMTGFCMGGRITFLSACRNQAIKAAVPFYGGGIGAAQPGHKSPLDYADRLQAPMLLFFGDSDPFIPMDEVERIKRRLAELHKNAEVVVYPGAPHGFFCNDRDSYRPEAAKDAWEKMGKFFAQHLQA